MKIYIVTCIVEEEYGGTENVAVFGNKADAEKYVAERQETFEAWWGNTVERYAIEEWKVS